MQTGVSGFEASTLMRNFLPAVPSESPTATHGPDILAHDLAAPECGVEMD